MVGATEMIWKELQGSEEMMTSIKNKMNDRDRTNRMEKYEKDRNTRMMKRDLKSKKWMEDIGMESWRECHILSWGLLKGNGLSMRN